MECFGSPSPIRRERRRQILKNRLLLENYFFPGDLKARIGRFVEHYNHRRYHERLSNFTPADVYFGRDESILLQRESKMIRTLSRSVAILGLATAINYPAASYSDDLSYRVAEGCTYEAFNLGLDSIVEIVRENPPKTREVFQTMREAFVEAVTNSGDCEFESGVADISGYQNLPPPLEGQAIMEILRLERRGDKEDELVIIVKPLPD